MLTAMFCALVAYLLLRTALRRRRRTKSLAAPLAGIDTGVRSPYRTPGRFFKPHKGF